ncbi:AAA family ATPase (plasmid) [Arthrobacter sp. YA7-1]|uniref:AAA family ATPase n=1 Tax=Arthrobacter sp. YA7-1 TaxID=2987701 RepID=UPI002227F2F5|nr:AAA family ATPase [Arthrobacter sp. YA7-1]UYY83586.1 AAA family ATPase [Arthrobacter sp. YA7-1]
MSSNLESVFLNGTVGSGKTTVAAALQRLLIADGVGNAVIDLDDLRRSWPVPREDPFNNELELRNLRAVASNYREAGVQRLILAGVIEHPADVERYRAALDGGTLTVIRLKPSLSAVHERLTKRDKADATDLSWYLRRGPELNQILEDADFDEYVVPIADEPPSEVAVAVRVLLGW